MGNDLALLYKYKSGETNDFYARRYMEDTNKTYYIDKIKEKLKTKAQEDPNYKAKKINEGALIQEAFSQYLQLDQKEKLSLLMNHPALTKEDFEAVLEMSVKSTEKAFYTAAGGSLVSYLIFKRFVERHYLFYDYFRRKPTYRVLGILKKTFSGLIVFYSWLAGANYFYKEKMKRQIADKGYLKKYYIDTDSVYVENDT